MIETPSPDARDTCRRCRRPKVVCYCAELPTLTPRTRVLFLQHPRERDMPIGTARMAHLSLHGSALVCGVRVQEDPVVANILDEGSVAVLYPGDDAVDVHDLTEPPRTLIVVDGTWSQAKKLIKQNPRIQALPRISLHPTSPGNYRIRKEPTDQHLATIEACALVLGVLEGDEATYTQLLRPFNFMVDKQLAAVAASTGARHKRRRDTPRSRAPELVPVVAAPERAVVLYAEGNCHARDHRAPGAPEVVHLLARIPATGATFEAVIAPRRPLGQHVDTRLGIAADALLSGEPVADALVRLQAFLPQRASWMMWGSYTRDLLVQEGLADAGFIDLRALAARHLQRSSGGIENAAAMLGVAAAPHQRRGVRRIDVLGQVANMLVQHAAQQLSTEEAAWVARQRTMRDPG